MGLTFILFCIVIFMFKRIQIAIEITKFASRAVGSMPTIVLVPVCGMLAAALIFVWVAVAGWQWYRCGFGTIV
jgi:hypothetical protein